ncbi:MAG: putative LPS assembly protein LptD [Owenweeksia sp.]|nr:putative LPS assembly protein LptD [Owenweeksia sp.]
MAFFLLPEKRKSGIILPSYGNSEYRGLFLRQGGYYWAINDYVDLTLLGDIYTQGGYGLTANTNYRKRYAYSGNLRLNYSRIKFGREEFEPFVPLAFDDRTDFSIRWNHNQDPKASPDFRFNSTVNIATSDFYKVNSVNANEVLSNELASSVSIQKTFPGKPFNLNLSLNHNQNNQTKDLTLKLPQISFGMNRLFPFRRQEQVGQKKWYEQIGLSYSSQAQNTIQTKLGKPIFTESVFRDSSRNGVQHNVDLAANYKVLNNLVFTPSVRYNERWYFQRSVWGYDEERQRAGGSRYHPWFLPRV